MSRSGYVDYDTEYPVALWRGAVASAFRGKRGQAFLREMAGILDAMPEKKLYGYVWSEGENACALGVVARAKGLSSVVEKFDPEDSEAAEEIAYRLGIAPAMAREFVWLNDEGGPYSGIEEPEARWKRMRAFVEKMLAAP